MIIHTCTLYVSSLQAWELSGKRKFPQREKRKKEKEKEIFPGEKKAAVQKRREAPVLVPHRIPAKQAAVARLGCVIVNRHLLLPPRAANRLERSHSDTLLR